MSSSYQEGQCVVSKSIKRKLNSPICLPFVKSKRPSLSPLSRSPRSNEDLVTTDAVMRDTVAVVMFVLSLSKLCWWNPARSCTATQYLVKNQRGPPWASQGHLMAIPGERMARRKCISCHNGLQQLKWLLLISGWLVFRGSAYSLDPTWCLNNLFFNLQDTATLCIWNNLVFHCRVHNADPTGRLFQGQLKPRGFIAEES